MDESIMKVDVNRVWCVDMVSFCPDMIADMAG